MVELERRPGCYGCGDEYKKRHATLIARCCGDTSWCEKCWIEHGYSGGCYSQRWWAFRAAAKREHTPITEGTWRHKSRLIRFAGVRGIYDVLDTNDPRTDWRPCGKMFKGHNGYRWRWIRPAWKKGAVST